MAGYSMTLRNLRANDILNQLGATGVLQLYDGTRPATGGPATNLLGSVPMMNPAGVVANAVLTFTKPNDAQASGTGTCTWARLSSGSTQVIDLSVSDTTGNGEVKLNTLSITPGLWMSVQSMVVTEGNP
jgi:hypothetical protein